MCVCDFFNFHVESFLDAAVKWVFSGDKSVGGKKTTRQVVISYGIIIYLLIINSCNFLLKT